MRFAWLMILFALAACHRATAAEVGTHERLDAYQSALMNASSRAHDVSPDVTPASANGTPMRQAPLQH